MIGKKINQLATELAPVSTDLTIIGDPDSGVSKKITLAQLGAIFSGAVSFYTNLASFPAVGDINVIYCAKDTQKLYLWSGSAYTEVFPAQALLDTYQLRSEKGVSNGYASLDSGGKVPISQLPSSIMEYKGTWNAATNTPTLANGTGDTGDVYICNVAGTVNFGAGAITFAVGDYVIYSGSIWQRSSGAVGTVTSVGVTRSGDALAITGSPITTSGTINLGFAGNSTQYINGAGNLVTFPSIINEAQNLITEVYNKTGATLTKGTVVYINGGQGNLPSVTKALATGDSTSAQTYGIVQADITNNNNGFVVVAGRLADIDTQAFSVGTQLYLSSTTAGAYTSTKQYAPAHLVYVGIIVRSHPTQGIIEVKIQNGYELDELHNVAAQTPTNNDGLFWEASTSLWKNKSIATILGYTPQAQLNGTGFVKASGTTITYDNSTYLTTSAAATTYLPLVLSSTANVVDINGQQFNIWGSASGNTSGRIIVDPVFSAIGYQNAGVFDGLKILTNGNAEFSNSGITRFFNQVRFDSTLTNGTYTYTLPGATGTLALVSQLTGGTVTSVGLSSATSGVTIGSTPITTSGTITLAIATASGSQQGLLSSTDWTTFNNKQNALTNPVTGTGTTNYLPKFTGTSTIGNSIISEVSGAINVAGLLTATGGLRTTGANGYSDTDGTSTIFVSANWTASQPAIVVTSNSPLTFWTNSVKQMTLTASGNLGLGVSPSAWDTTLSKAIQLNGGSLWGYSTSQINLLQNAFYNTSGDIAYVNSASASAYRQISGVHSWLTAPSGTAGNAISFTQAMTLDASGRLGIGATSMTYALQVNDVAGGNMFRFASGSTVLDYYVSGGNPSFGTASNNDLRFRTNDTTRLTIASTGAATFSSSVTTGGNILVPAGSGLAWSGDASRIMTPEDNVSGALIQTPGIIRFNAGGSEKVRITSGGNVGIGTTSPDDYGAGFKMLSINGSTAGILQLRSNNSQIINIVGTVNSADFEAFLNKEITFKTGTSSVSERMRITSGGNVGIGTTSPISSLMVSKTLASNQTYLTLDNKTNSKYNWGIDWAVLDSTNIPVAAIRAIYPVDNDVSLGFYTYNGSGNVSERMRITSGGNVGIGTSSPGCLLHIQAPAASYGLFRITSTSNSSGEASINFGRTDQNIDDRWTIGQGTAGSGNTFGFYTSTSNKATLTTAGVWSTTGGGTSDARTKQDIEYNFDNGIEALTKLQPTKFRFKSAPDKQRRGFIAQDVLQVIPDLVLGDGELKNGTYGLDYDGILALAVKAIQELKQELDTLKNK